MLSPSAEMIRWALTLALLLSACGTGSLIQTALHGDLQTLKREVRREQQRGTLDRDRAIDLARAVAGREVRSARGPGAPERIRGVAGCAGELSAVLSDRATRGDDVGAEAALLLLEARREDAADALRYREASSGPWRAVAARAAVGSSHGSLRRRFFVDPDERVRRAALRAAAERPDAADLDPLLETARLDPDPLSRSMATRVAGAIGGEAAVLALKDLWARADPEERLSIVDAWAMPRALAAGGERELLTVTETGRGTTALAAADALIRARADRAGGAVEVLVRAVAEGSLYERRYAIDRVPLGAAAMEALWRAAKGDDRYVQVAALSRLSKVREQRARAVASLRELAASKHPVALDARLGLARAGDPSAAPGLRQTLASRRASERRQAALGLIELGDFSAAATALADDDPDVRTDVACSMLSSR